MTKTCKGPKVCAAMVRAAARRVARGIAAYPKKNEADASMRRMLRKDARDMMTVAAHVARGDKAGASRKARSMDTAARDEIPLPVYCWLGWYVKSGCTKGSKQIVMDW